MARRRQRGMGGSVLAFAVLLAIAALARTATPESAGDPGPRKPRTARAAGHGALPESPFRSRADCERLLEKQAKGTRGAPRLGTWNVRWFPLGTASGHDPERHTDLPWLACAIAALRVDLLAVQEITMGPRGRTALLDLLAELDARTGGRHRFEVDDCPGDGRQHIAFIYDAARVQLSEVRNLAALNPGESACDRNLRPGLAAYARFTGGPDLHVVAVHLDSGKSPRDFGHRARSFARLDEALGELRRSEPDADVVVLGDFNTMGCKDCPEGQLDERDELERVDAVLPGFELRRLALPENRRCTHYYGSRSGWLDHVLVSSALSELADPALDVFGTCRDLGCAKLRSDSSPEVFRRLSDHCPVILQLAARDEDEAARPARASRRAVTRR